MMYRKEVFAIILFMVASLVASPALAVPAAPFIHTLEGKDGSQFTAILWGDEFSHGWETTDGYTVIFNETTKEWTYAIPGADGNLVSSKIIVGSDLSSSTIQKHIRPTGNAQATIQNFKASQVTAINEKAVAATGTANIPVILINFNDRSTTYTPGTFNTLLFGTGTKSLKDYFQEVSYGKFSLSSGPGGVVGWYTASNGHDYYGTDFGGLGNDHWFGTLVREAVIAADPTFNFAPYDNNGDCYVDSVIIIHQGTGQEASAIPTDIWSQSSSLNGLYPGYSNGPEITTNDACPSGGFIKINEFVIQPETLPTSFGGPQQTIGIFAHEFGHALGLPDLYDTTDASEGVGHWSVMGSGNWLGISVIGDTPAHPDAWSKLKLGWLSPTQISTSRITTVGNAENNNEAYQLLDNPGGVNDWTRSGTGKGEYFLVENRHKTGFDAALPGEGLLIWHIDESIGNNDDKNHKLVDLEEADGLNDMDNKINRGDAFDPWYNKITGFTEATTPNSHFYNGSDSGVRITNIGASGTTMEAFLIVPGGSVSSTKIGIFRNGLWVLDNNGNFAWDGPSTDRAAYLGQTDDNATVGAWGGAGIGRIGVFRNGLWVLDYNGNFTWDGPSTDRAVYLGQAGDIPVIGNWSGTGTGKIGVFRNGLWVLDYNGNFAWDGPSTDRAAYLGQAGDIPVIGNWNGDGTGDKIGIFRNGLWVLDYNGNFAWDGPSTDRAAYLGQAGDTPVIGDWNGDGKKKIGVFRNGLWVLDYNGNFAWDGPSADRAAYLGQAGDTPVVGDWNGDGKDEIGVFRNGLWVLDYNGNFTWDGPSTDRAVYLGQPGDTPVMGKWS